tara:strand:+ start:1304 stop:1729 length:426 start_codon:yes stop_codon:yes gene_type:complete
MGRNVKNPILQKAGTASITIPSGSTASRPIGAKLGATRFNTSYNNLEVWNGSVWRLLAAEGTTVITKDTFTGDGSSTVFGAMSFNKNVNDETSVLVFVGNVHQNPGTAYSFNNSDNITFTSPPPAAHSIVVIHGLNSTVAV